MNKTLEIHDIDSEVNSFGILYQNTCRKTNVTEMFCLGECRNQGVVFLLIGITPTPTKERTKSKAQVQIELQYIGKIIRTQECICVIATDIARPSANVGAVCSFPVAALAVFSYL
jgi:hypothetical protein